LPDVIAKGRQRQLPYPTNPRSRSEKSAAAPVQPCVYSGLYSPKRSR